LGVAVWRSGDRPAVSIDRHWSSIQEIRGETTICRVRPRSEKWRVEFRRTMGFFVMSGGIW
jgi:hypothetical protein